MSLHIQAIQTADAAMWDAYVHSHPQATLYHRYGWRNVIEKTYGHKTYYLAAIRHTSPEEFKTPPKNSGFDQPISHQPSAISSCWTPPPRPPEALSLWQQPHLHAIL